MQFILLLFVHICMATEDLDAGNVWNPTLTCLIRSQSHLYTCNCLNTGPIYQPDCVMFVQRALSLSEELFL